MPLEKTIVILLGNARGGEKTWRRMYENLLQPYNADLALCFGYSEDKSASLYQNAKYIWELPEYEEWADYFVENFGSDGPWKKSFEMAPTSGFSGLWGTVGSGAIFCAFQHYIYKYKKDILLEYDRIIVTRSDFFYLKQVPVFANEFCWIPTGDDHGGLCDRFKIFPSSHFDEVLGIVDNYINTENFHEDFKDFAGLSYHINFEKCHLNHFKRIDYLKNIRGFPRVQFLVKTKSDMTRWGQTDMLVPFHDDLFIKYENEFNETMKSIFTAYQGDCYVCPN